MKFAIKTRVQQAFAEADKSFTKEYLTKLNPEFPPFKILRYDGTNDGDEIHVQLNFGLFKQNWTYQIKNKTDTMSEWSFVDEAITTPFFLKYWHHQIKMEPVAGHMLISDTVIFKSPFLLLDYALFPWLYVHFLYRRPIYRKRYSLKQ
jgi:ligand-binding SRPBCC domain-containing protein